MASPVITTIPIDVWTKIATAVTSGAILPLAKISSGGYVQTIRATGAGAPTDGDTEQGKSLPWEGGIIDSSSSIDVYIAVTGDVAGSVRADL